MSGFYNITKIVDKAGILFNETLDDEDVNCSFTPTTRETISCFAGKSFLVTIYSLASLAALLGNSVVIVVELYGSESAQNIRKYLINLAVADIILGVFCVPLTYSNFISGQWILPHWLCPITQYVQLLSVFVTSITLSLIGLERYLAILYPFSHLHRWLESHTNVVLTIVWALGASYSAIPMENTHIRQNDAFNLTTYSCAYTETSLLRERLFMSTNFILTFLMPLVVLIWAYSGIVNKLINDQKEIQRNTNDTNSKSGNTFYLRRSFMLHDQTKPLYVFGILEFCTEAEYDTINWIFFACDWTSMASSFVNPIVYSFMSKSFRKDLKNITNTFHYNKDQSSIRTISFQV